MSNPFKSNKNEILYNLINSAIAGGLVFLGSLTAGDVTIQSVGISIAAAMAVCLAKFKDYWETQKKEYCPAILDFF